jgi:hypothetical protein
VIGFADLGSGLGRTSRQSGHQSTVKATLRKLCSPTIMLVDWYET